MSGQINLVYDVHDGEDIHAAYLVRLTNQDLVAASYRHPHRGTGYGSITLQATSSHHSNLARGHYVRVRDVDLSYAVVGGFFLDEFEETVLSKKEGGGKLFTWRGASTISYLARAVLDDEVRSSAAGPHDQFWIDTTGNWHWGSAGGEAYGDIIRRIVVEAGLQTPNPIPAIDSTGGYASSVTSTATETFTGTYEIPVGTNLLQAVMALARTGIDVWMDPDSFDIEIVDEGDFVRDKTGAFGAGTVRFEGGVNIAADLKRVRHQSQYVSHMVVIGEGVEPFTVTDPSWSAGDPVRGGTLHSDLTHTNELTRAALADIRARRRKIEQATFPHLAGDTPASGWYRPSDRNVGGHYAPGDLVTLHTGTGAGQYNELSIEVAAVSWLLEENGLHSVRVELGSSYVSASQQATDNRLGNVIGGCKCWPLCGPTLPAIGETSLWSVDYTDGADDLWTDACTGNPTSLGGGGIENPLHGCANMGAAKGISASAYSGWVDITDDSDIVFRMRVAKRGGAGTQTVTLNWGTAATPCGAGDLGSTVYDITGIGLGFSDTCSHNSWTDKELTITPPAGATMVRFKYSFDGAMATASISHTGVAAIEGDCPADVGEACDPGTAPRAARCDHVHAHPLLVSAPPYHAAAGVTYDNTDSGLTAEEAQGAIDELDGRIDALEAAPSLHSALGVVLDGGGSALTTGVKGFVRVPFACTIVRASLLADQVGSIVVDVWKDTYANFPPTVADTITASAKPTLSSAQKSEDTTLTGWTTTLNEGEVLGFNVESAATVQRVTLELRVLRT